MSTVETLQKIKEAHPVKFYQLSPDKRRKMLDYYLQNGDDRKTVEKAYRRVSDKSRTRRNLESGI